MIKALLRVLCFASKWIHRSKDNISYYNNSNSNTSNHPNTNNNNLFNGVVDVGVLRANVGGL